MRRKDREITDIEDIKKIVNQAVVCNVAMCHANIPYLIPMNFGFDGEYIYLHSFPEGLKVDILKENPQVCIGVMENVEYIPSSESVCQASMKYSSVIIDGKAELLSNKSEKTKGIMCIVQKYYCGISGEEKKSATRLIEDYYNKLAVFRVKIEKITGKRSV